MKKLIRPIVPLVMTGILVFSPGRHAVASGKGRMMLERPTGVQTVTGIVVDETGQPLLGVTVLEKGTNKGTVTDAAGTFSLEAGSGATLVFSFVGFIAQEVVDIIFD